MTEPIEVEAKFEIDQHGRKHVLALDRIGIFAVVQRTQARQDDIYYDTASGALAAAGASLRVRRASAAATLTFKGRREPATAAGDEFLVARLEDEVTLDSTDASTISVDRPLKRANLSPLKRAEACAGSDAFEPVARIENDRTTLLLHDGRERTIELALDDCRGIRLRDGRVTTFGEVELEAKSASRQDVIEVANGLRAQIPSLRASSATKLERTLR